MALDTYTALKASVESWLHRTNLSAVIPDLIALAEEQMSRDLAGCPALFRQQTTGLTLTAGNNELTLDSVAQGLKVVKMLTPTADELRIVTANALFGADASSGIPDCVAMLGSAAAGTTKLLVYPTPDQTCTFAALYSARVTPLSDSEPTNFVLLSAPSIYLYGTLLQAEPYMANDARLPTWQLKYSQAVEAFMGLEWSGNALLGTDIPTISGGGYDITRD